MARGGYYETEGGFRKARAERTSKAAWIEKNMAQRHNTVMNDVMRKMNPNHVDQIFSEADILAQAEALDRNGHFTDSYSRGHQSLFSPKRKTPAPMKAKTMTEKIEITADHRAAKDTEKAWAIWGGEYTESEKYGKQEKITFLPKSQVDFDGDKTFMVPEWLAKEKGLI